MDFENIFRFGANHTGSTKVDLTGAKRLLAEAKRRKAYFHSIEVHEISGDGDWIPRNDFIKKGLSGEDEFSTLEQHYAFDEQLLLRASNTPETLIFEIWLSPKSGLPKKETS